VSEVTVPARTTQVLSYSGSSEIPGTYIVTLGERTEQFVVVEPGELILELEPDELTEPSNELTRCGCGSNSARTQCGCGGSSEITGAEPNTPSCCGG